MSKLRSPQIDTGTGADQLVKLDGSGNLPAVNGSFVTNVDAVTVGGDSAADLHDAAQLSGSVADARITQSNVTQHEAALSIAGSQLSGTVDANTLGGQPVGTTANDIVALDASSRLPAVDGSLLTNLPSGSSLVAWADVSNGGNTGESVVSGGSHVITQIGPSNAFSDPSGIWDDVNNRFDLTGLGAGDYLVSVSASMLWSTASNGSLPDNGIGDRLIFVSAFSDRSARPATSNSSTLAAGQSISINMGRTGGTIQMVVIQDSGASIFAHRANFSIAVFAIGV